MSLLLLLRNRRRVDVPPAWAPVASVSSGGVLTLASVSSLLVRPAAAAGSGLAPEAAPESATERRKATVGPDVPKAKIGR